MTSRTGLQVITDALKLLGVVAGHEVPTAAEQHDALARLNELIDAWGTHAQTMAVRQRAVLTLVANQQSYTVGIGGDLDVVRPIGLMAAAWLTATTPAVEIGLPILTDQEYFAIPVKTLTSAQPTAVVYDATVPLGTLWVWPVPTGSGSVALYWDEAVQAFPDLVTPVVLHEGYARALRTNLAVELASEFGKAVDPVLDRAARESLADVKRQNLALVELVLSGVPGVSGGSYAIGSDS